MSMNDGLRLVDPLAYGGEGYPHEEWARLRPESPASNRAPGSKRLSIRYRLSGGC